jgi:hypothetical protein
MRGTMAAAISPIATASRNNAMRRVLAAEDAK